MTTTIPDGVAQNVASTAASLTDDAIAFIGNPTPQNATDLLVSMRIMQQRLAKARALTEEEAPMTQLWDATPHRALLLALREAQEHARCVGFARSQIAEALRFLEDCEKSDARYWAYRALVRAHDALDGPTYSSKAKGDRDD